MKIRKFSQINESYYSHEDFNLGKFNDISNFLRTFSDYNISELIINIDELKEYQGDLSELFSSLSDANKYGDVGSKEDKLQYLLLEYSIDDHNK